MTLRQKRDVFNKMLGALIAYAQSQNIPLEEGEGFRPYWVAVEYVRRKVGILLSLHRQGLAHDFWITNDDGTEILWEDIRYKTLADYWVSIGGRAGYYFKRKDAYHFEFGGE